VFSAAFKVLLEGIAEDGVEGDGVNPPREAGW
jgi:hypothetical protein